MLGRPADASGAASPGGAATPGRGLRPWLARLSFALAFLAIAVVVAFAEWKSWLACRPGRG